MKTIQLLGVENAQDKGISSVYLLVWDFLPLDCFPEVSIDEQMASDRIKISESTDDGRDMLDKPLLC